MSLLNEIYAGRITHGELKTLLILPNLWASTLRRDGKHGLPGYTCPRGPNGSAEGCG